MTAVFQDIEFGSRYPEFSKDHQQSKCSGYLEGHCSKPKQDSGKDQGLGGRLGRLQGNSLGSGRGCRSPDQFLVEIHVGLDEVEIFGLPGESVNLAHESLGTTVKTDIAFAQQEDVFRLAESLTESSEHAALAGKLPQGKETEPLAGVCLQFSGQSRTLRISTNREYYYETDYLQQKNKFNFDQFVVHVKLPDGT